MLICYFSIFVLILCLDFVPLVLLLYQSCLIQNVQVAPYLCVLVMVRTRRFVLIFYCSHSINCTFHMHFLPFTCDSRIPNITTFQVNRIESLIINYFLRSIYPSLQPPLFNALLTPLSLSIKLKLKYHSKIPSNIPPTLIFVLSNFQFIFDHLIILSFQQFLSPISHTPAIKYFISPITTIITLSQHPFIFIIFDPSLSFAFLSLLNLFSLLSLLLFTLLFFISYFFTIHSFILH